MTSQPISLAFFPIAPDDRMKKVGFRVGARGTHSSRTLMLEDLSAVLDASPRRASRADYEQAIVEGNCLRKPTSATRRLSNQRLGELYSLDHFVIGFRVMRALWWLDLESRPLLALLFAIARDPLLLASAEPVLRQNYGAEFARAEVRSAIQQIAHDRMSDATIEKVVRNVASTWEQAGHLRGRTFKFRQRARSRPVAMAFALWLARSAGFHNDNILKSGWVSVLDCTAAEAHSMALEASRLGLIGMRAGGELVEFEIDRLDPGLPGD